MKSKKKTAALDFKGNKLVLPRKACKTCGRIMVWRKSWARNWEAVQYCSTHCRKHKPPTELSEQWSV